MCHTITPEFPGHEPKRELQHPAGKIVQCLGCSSVGVEFKTSYMTFPAEEFPTFVRWFEALEWREANAEGGRLRIKVRRDSAMMLSLSRRELGSLVELLSAGLEWVTSAVVSPDGSCPGLLSFETSSTIH
ncbi:MAG: DUF6686 family protein [Acidobacteriota bacterium]